MKYLLMLIMTMTPLTHLSVPMEHFQKLKFNPGNTSSQGVALIKTFESFREAPYKDSNGIKTIGYGHVLTPMENKSVNRITEKEATELLYGDIRNSEQCIKHLIPFKLKQNQFDALVSFVFNVGCANFKNSRIYYYITQKDFEEAKFWWTKWVHGKNGRQLRGLIKRRFLEIDLFKL